MNIITLIGSGDGFNIINNNFKNIDKYLTENYEHLKDDTSKRISSDSLLNFGISGEQKQRIISDLYNLSTLSTSASNIHSLLTYEISARQNSIISLNNSISGVSQSLSGYTSISQTNALSGLLTLNSTTKSISASLQNEIDIINNEIIETFFNIPTLSSFKNYETIIYNIDTLINEATYPIFDGFGVAGLNTTFTRASSAYDPINNSIVNLNTARVKSIDIGSHTIYAPLIEGARTNIGYIAIYGEGSIISSDTDGYSRCTDSGGNTIHRIIIVTPTLTAGQTYTASLQVTYDGSARYIYMNSDTGIAATATFDLLLGTVVVGMGSANIKPAKDGGWILSITGICPGIEDGVWVQVNNSFVATDDPYQASGKFFRYKNSQIEIGNFASTYIPTTGTPVTRDADACTWTVGPQLAAGQGTLFAIGNDSTFKQVCEIYGGVALAGDCELTRQSSTSGTSQLSSVQSIDTYGALPTGQYTEAISWNGVTRSTYINGALLSANPDASIATGTALNIGSLVGLFQPFDHTTTLFFPRVLTPSEIQLLDFGVRNSSELNKQLLLPKVSIGYPNIIPDRIGQIYIDSNSKLSYIAVGLNKSDWRQFTY